MFYTKLFFLFDFSVSITGVKKKKWITSTGTYGGFGIFLKTFCLIKLPLIYFCVFLEFFFMILKGSVDQSRHKSYSSHSRTRHYKQCKTIGDTQRLQHMDVKYKRSQEGRQRAVHVPS